MEPKQPNRTSRRRGGRPSLLSQGVIVAAAQRIIDTEADGSLSMRRLARELAITPMALYHHVRDKDELLMLLLETKARNMPRPPLPPDPRERLVTSSQLLYDMLADCPFLGEILSSDDLLTASNLWIIEAMLEAAVECGFEPAQAVGVYRVIWHYTAGELMVRHTHARRLAQLGQTPYRERAFADMEPTGLPRLHALADRWTELTARNTHREGLEGIVRGFLHGVEPPAPGSAHTGEGPAG